MNWNISDWALRVIPSLMRKEPVISFVRALLTSISAPYSVFVTYKAEMLKKVRYNGQQIILENLLNDVFDNTARGIVIITATDIEEPVYIATPAETAPVFIATPAETAPVYIGLPDEYGYTFDFLVLVPTSLLTSEQETQLKSITNYYKIAGKTPRFQYANGTIF